MMVRQISSLWFGYCFAARTLFKADLEFGSNQTWTVKKKKKNGGMLWLI